MDKIKPPCGIYGDIAPLWCDGHWCVSSYTMPKDKPAFTWPELVELGVADTNYKCEEIIIQLAQPTSEEVAERKRQLQERWERRND